MLRDTIRGQENGRGFLTLIRLPRQEIRHLWLADYSILKKTVDVLVPPTELHTLPSPITEDGTTRAQIQALACASDYLLKAGRSWDLADGWSFLNLATAFLVRGVDEDDLEAASIGLLSCDRALSKTASNRVHEMEKLHGLLDEGKKPRGKPPDRGRLFDKLMLRSYVWDGSNRRISMRTCLLLWVGLILFVLLAAVAWMVYGVTSDSRYVAMPLLGLFGGGLSATIRARKSAVDALSFRIILVQVLVRMIIGAAGAFVVYIALRWPGLFADQLVRTVMDNYYALVGLGIAAGFSERLFVGALEKIARKLSINSEDSEVDEAEGKSDTDD